MNETQEQQQEPLGAPIKHYENFECIDCDDSERFDIFPPYYAAVGVEMGALPKIDDGDFAVGRRSDGQVIILAADSGAMLAAHWAPATAKRIGQAIIDAADEILRDAALQATPASQEV